MADVKGKDDRTRLLVNGEQPSRVMLFSGCSAGVQSVGNLLIKEALEQLPGRVACCVHMSGRAVAPGFTGGLPFLGVDRFSEWTGWCGHGWRIEECSALLHHYWLMATTVRRTVAEIVQFGRAYEINTIWAILDWPSNVFIAAIVAEKLGARLVCVVWDPVRSRAALSAGRSRWFVRLVENAFKQIMAAADGCGVASEAMKEAYEAEFSCPCVVLRKTVPKAWVWPVVAGLKRADRLVVGFAGSLYAADAVEAFLQALAGAQWKLEGRSVRLRVVGNRIPVVGGAVDIEFMGFRSEEETIRLLHECDVAYLPYSFQSSFAESARLCSPGKLSNYIAAGIPTFYHGPRDSMPTRMFESYKIGVTCHSTDAVDILQSMARLVGDRALWQSFGRERDILFVREFDRDVYRARLGELLALRRNGSLR